MSAITYMRFRHVCGTSDMYFVGTSEEHMRMTARQIGVAPGHEEGEVVNSELVILAAEADRTPLDGYRRDRKVKLDAGVAAARGGAPSYYLFG